MDRFVRIYSLLFIMILIFVATGCSPQSSAVNKVFQEPSYACEARSHKTRYVVKKKDGSIVKVHANSREELIEKYVIPKLEELEIVESDQLIYANDLMLSNDGPITPNAQETWGAERIQANVAWNSGVKGQNVLVAVIDSGVEISHPSLSSKIYVNTAELNGARGVDDDENGLVDDVRGWDFSLNSAVNHDTSGHGTHVAGVIAGAHSGPMKGVAPDAKILPIDFMDGGSGYTSDAIKSINYAKLMKAHVINASWGSDLCSRILEDTILSLVDENILFVAAAGNNGNDISRYPEFPAAFRSSAQITVGAITQLGFMPSFSNYGQLVDVMAPGDEILSSYTGGDYAYLSGTSMAAPFVSGLAALIVGKKPDITVSQLKSVILESVTKRNYSVKTEGEINVPQALTLLNSL